MDSLLYIRLIGYTAGTLLQLFWMVVILGYRRQRNFERVFFFLCLALFFFYSGSLLALNSQIYYHQPPVALNQFAIAIISTGLCLLPALLLHLHLEYAKTRGLLKDKRWKLAVLFLFYAACLHVAVHRIPLLLQDPQFNFLVPGSSLGEGFAIVLAVALAWCGGWERRFATAAPDKPQRYFHWTLLGFFVATFLAVDGLHLGPFHMQAQTAEALATVFSLLPSLPFSVLIYLVYRHNFLQIGRQKNLLYAISATFLALLYLSLVRRVGTWLEPLLPPEASASILLFVLVILCEQLPGALDLCRLIEEQLRLERELAERERLALVGQMAASISHNLKNPLGSMKTILQVQLENPELPDSMRAETKIVLEEVGRLSTKLNQLLQFSRPAVRGGSAIGSCDARVAVEEVAGVLSHEAERRGVKMQTKVSGNSAKVAASAEALHDIVSNLVVNALEATPRGGRVLVAAVSKGSECVLAVEDDGPGVPVALQEKILQPFFTTKSQGTGLGLAIVARRVTEFGGKMGCESPVRDGRGTRFQVTLPLEEAKKQ